MLIGITGCKGAGKNTAADFLDGYTQLGFADKLKEAVANLFGMHLSRVNELKEFGQIELMIDRGYPKNTTSHYTRRQFSGREFLQRFGTEMARNTFGQDFWVDQWEAAYNDVTVNGPTPVVVTDVRFPNEAIRIKMLDGAVIEIVRPGHEPDGHKSEEPLPDGLIDIRIYNNGTLDDLRTKVLATVEALEVGVHN